MEKKLWMDHSCVRGLVSVIITTYQREKYIISTLESIKNQTYRPIEVILIDDGSYDNTKEIVERWIVENISNDGLLNLHFIIQNNTGAPTARNRALVKSKGEFIQEVGSDDLIHSQKIEMQVKALRLYPDTQSAWSPLYHYLDGDEDECVERMIKNPVHVKYECIETNSNIFIPEFLPSAALHRREVFILTGPWSEKLKRWQDLEYQSRMALNVKKYLKFEYPMYFFRQHSGERINSQYKQENGIDAGLFTLKQIEINFHDLKYKDKDAYLAVSSFYFSLSVLCIKFNKKKKLIYTLYKACYFRRKIKFVTKSFALATIALIAPKLALKIVRGKTNIPV